MTPLEAATLRLQIAILWQKVFELVERNEMTEARLKEMEARITKLEYLINRQQPQFSEN